MTLFQAFAVVFQGALEAADPSKDVRKRLDNLIDCITYSVFMYTTRGLFEQDKLIFTAQLTFQVIGRNWISAHKIYSFVLESTG